MTTSGHVVTPSGPRDPPHTTQPPLTGPAALPSVTDNGRGRCADAALAGPTAFSGGTHVPLNGPTPRRHPRSTSRNVVRSGGRVELHRTQQTGSGDSGGRVARGGAAPARRARQPG